MPPPSPTSSAVILPRRAALISAASMLILAACSPGSDLVRLPDVTDTIFRLGPGDQVRVITFGEQTLTGEFRVSDAGSIAVPLLGTVQAAGLSTRELENKIVRELQAKHLFKNPSVSVEVLSYRPVFVLGEVNKPGQYPYQPGMTVVSAVAVAGGFTYRAWEKYASVVRSSGTKAVEGRVERQGVLEPGDVVTVLERIF